MDLKGQLQVGEVVSSSMKESWKAAICRGRRRRRQQQFRTGDHHLFFMQRGELLPPAAANAQASCPQQQPTGGAQHQISRCKVNINS